MTVLMIQSLLLLLAAFVVGCLIGCLLRRASVSDSSRETEFVPQRATRRPARIETPPPSEPMAEVKPVADPVRVTDEAPTPVFWQADLGYSGLTLSGAVPSIAERDRLFATARSTFEDLVVSDSLVVRSGTHGSVSLLEAAGFAFDGLRYLASGRARIEGGTVSFSGELVPDAPDTALAAETLARALPSGLELGTLDIVRAGGAPTPSESDVLEPGSGADQPDLPAEGVLDMDDAPTVPRGAPLPVEAPNDLPGRQPSGLVSPRDGAADDLKKIKGIGKVNEAKLNALGIWHFAQIAAWTEDEIAWVDGFLAFKGRIGREDWVSQARALSE